MKLNDRFILEIEKPSDVAQAFNDARPGDTVTLAYAVKRDTVRQALWRAASTTDYIAEMLRECEPGLVTFVKHKRTRVREIARVPVHIEEAVTAFDRLKAPSLMEVPDRPSPALRRHLDAAAARQGCKVYVTVHGDAFVIVKTLR